VTYRQLLASNQDFRRLWIGQVVSEIGDWLNNIAVLALTIQAASQGREGLAISLYAVSRHLPLFVFGPLAGVIVDRADRRRVMIAADVGRAMLAPAFLLATAGAALPVIYITGAALFSVSAFFNAAKRASIPNLVRGADQLITANSLSASTTAATIAVGSALGGIVATFAGRQFVFILNALTFLVSAEMIRRIKGQTRRHLSRVGNNVEAQAITGASAAAGEQSGYALEGDNPVRDEQSIQTSSKSNSHPRRWKTELVRVFREFRDGLRYVYRVDLLFAIFMVAGFWGLGNGVARALYSLFGAHLGAVSAAGLVARPTEFGISVLFVAMGVGGILGAPIARRHNTSSPNALEVRMGRSLFLDGSGLVLFSFMPNLVGAALVLIAREINFAIWWTAQQTLVMTATDDRYSGRVFASFETLTTLAMVGSMVVAGLAADQFGIRPVATAGGSVVMFSGVLWFILRRRRGVKIQSKNAECTEL
jgi:MFS family permease